MFFLYGFNNIRPNYPLVVSGRERRNEESYHYVCFKYTNPKEGKYYSSSAEGPKIKYIPESKAGGCVETLDVTQSEYYPCHEFIGKSCTRVGRDASGNIIGNDSEIYDKWSQAVSSAYGLLEETLHEIEVSFENTGLNVILPILIVPDKRLWIAEYDAEGN